MTERFECQQLDPFKACGLVGSCEGNETQPFCECSPGWESREEMTLYFLPREEIAEGISICNFNRNILNVLYILVLISALGALGMQSYMISTKKQLKRLIPLLTGLTFQAILAIYRLSRPNDALNGKDVFFTFLVSNGGFFNWFAVNIFINKYFRHISKKARFELESSLQQFRRHQKVNSMALGFEFVLYQICWTTVLFARQDTVGRVVLRITFGLLALRTLYYTTTVHLLFGSFILDIKTVVKLAEARNNHAIEMSSKQTKAQNYIEKVLLPYTISIKKHIIVSTAFYSMFLAISALWDYALLFYGYFFPLNLISWGILNIAVLMIGVKKKLSRSLNTSSTRNKARP